MYPLTMNSFIIAKDEKIGGDANQLESCFWEERSLQSEQHIRLDLTGNIWSTRHRRQHSTTMRVPSTILLVGSLSCLQGLTMSFSPVYRAAHCLVESGMRSSPALTVKLRELQATVVAPESETVNVTVMGLEVNDSKPGIPDIDVTISAVIESSDSMVDIIEKEEELLKRMETTANLIVEEILDETCEVNPSTGGAVDEICVDERKRKGFRDRMKGYVRGIEDLVVGRKEGVAEEKKAKKVLDGDALEAGCKFDCERNWYKGRI
jgi:hypothetical protein